MYKGDWWSCVSEKDRIQSSFGSVKCQSDITKCEVKYDCIDFSSILLPRRNMEGRYAGDCTYYKTQLLSYSGR